MVNTKICTGNERKFNKGINSGYYRIYQKREKNFNSFQIDFLEQLKVYICNNGHSVTEYLQNVKTAKILEYKDKTCIMFYNKEGDNLTEYEFETVLNQKKQINYLSFSYCTLLESKFFAFDINTKKMKKEKFLDKTFNIAPVSHLLITDDFEELCQQKKILLSIVSNPDYTVTTIENLQDIKFKVLGETIKNATKMVITEKRAEEVIKIYATEKESNKLVKKVKGSEIIKSANRLLCLKARRVWDDVIQLVESEEYFLYPFLDTAEETSKKLLPLE